MSHILFNSGSDAIMYDCMSFEIDEKKTCFEQMDNDCNNNTFNNEAYLNIQIKFDARFVSIYSDNKNRD